MREEPASSPEADRPGDIGPRASGLHADLAARILAMLKERGAGRGYHLAENELCRILNVSRTPVRGALRVLEQQGRVEARVNRGYVLREAVVDAPVITRVRPEREEDHRLFVAIATARNAGRIPDRCSQRELAAILGAMPTHVLRVLEQMAALGIVEHKPGLGWSFALPINSGEARAESYAFRAIVEPAGMIEPRFALDRDWLAQSRARHIHLRMRAWDEALAVELFEINADFHAQIARCSGNRYIEDAVIQQNRLRSFLNIQWVNGRQRVLDSIDEHLAILDALDAGDNRAASALMHRHLMIARDLEPTIS